MSCTVYDVTCRRYASQTHPINAAINDAVAEGGGTVYLPARTYFVPSPIVVPYAAATYPYDPAPSIHLVGDGVDNTLVQRYSALGTHDLISIERDFTTVSGITFDGGPGSSASGRGIVIGQVLDSNPVSPGYNVGRVFRRIELHNVLVRNTVDSALMLLGGGSTAPLSINCSYTDCVFAANRNTASACVHVQPNNTTQMFRGCTIDGFNGHGVYLDGCSGITFFNGHVEWTQSNNHPYVTMTNARDINLENMWFEEADSSAAAANQWFVYISDACKGVSVKNCIFVRKRDTAFAVGVGADGPSRGILISNPLVVHTVAPSATDNPIWLLNSDTEAIVEGGIVQYNTTYKSIEINDQANYSTHLSNDRRLRLPRLGSSDISAFISSNRRASDLINRDIASIRTGSGLEAYSSAGSVWLPLTVNRYAADTNLNSETSRDRGTLAWVDTPALLKTYDGTSWRPVVRQVAAYDQGGLLGMTTPVTLYTPPAAGTYRVALIATVTTSEFSVTLNFRVGWTDEFSNAQLKTVALNMGTVGTHIEFDVPLNSAASQPITISTATAATTGNFTVHARVENI